MLCRKYSTSENKEKTVLWTPHHLYADPCPAFHFDADLDPDPTFDPDHTTNFFPELSLQAPMLQNKLLRLPPFHFDAYPDPAFRFDADLDPPFHFDAVLDRIRILLP